VKLKNKIIEGNPIELNPKDKKTKQKKRLKNEKKRKKPKKSRNFQQI
jgi:hypothetical protein